MSTEVSTPPHESSRPEQVATRRLEGIQVIGQDDEHGGRRRRKSTGISSSRSNAKEREQLQTSLDSSPKR